MRYAPCEERLGVDAMLVTELKSKGSILPLLDGRTFIICCEGCSEIFFPKTEVAELVNALQTECNITGITVADFICAPDHLSALLAKYKTEIDAADSILVFSCGVGVQTVADMLVSKRVLAGCDTYPLPGVVGVTPLEFDCAGCERCLLNETGGFCPVTACAKGLTNGPCGGSKDGKCETDRNVNCAWEGTHSTTTAT